MTTGTDYDVDTDGDAFRSYVRAVSDVMHGAGMGSCYWPGLRNGDFQFRPTPQHPEADVGTLGQVTGPLRFR
jgi:hypothetical protein